VIPWLGLDDGLKPLKTDGELLKMLIVLENQRKLMLILSIRLMNHISFRQLCLM